MNISELKAHSFRAFSRQKTEKREANVASVKYIETIAHQTGTNIRGWNLVDLFGDGSGRLKLISDRNEINRRFFEHRERYEAGISSELIELEKHIRGPLDLLFDKSAKSRIQHLKKSFNDYIRHAINYQNEAELQSREAAACERAIEGIEGRPNTFSQEVIEVLKEGFWVFHQFQNNHLTLYTKSDIILTEVNPSANLNIRVNVGQFQVRFSVVDGSLTVHTHANNIMVGSHYHPHVNSNGQICWGNVKDAAFRHLAKLEFKSVMGILTSLLSTYSPTQPYRRLNDFYERRPDQSVGDINGPQETEEEEITGAETVDSLAGVSVQASSGGPDIEEGPGEYGDF